MDVAHALRIGRQILLNLFARERLGEEPAPPVASPAAPRRRSFWRLLLAPEALPLDPEPARPPRGRVRLIALLAPEALPEEPPPAPRPARSRWLRWLFVPESLDPRP